MTKTAVNNQHGCWLFGHGHLWRRSDHCIIMDRSLIRLILRNTPYEYQFLHLGLEIRHQGRI